MTSRQHEQNEDVYQQNHELQQQQQQQQNTEQEHEPYYADILVRSLIADMEDGTNSNSTTVSYNETRSTTTSSTRSTAIITNHQQQQQQQQQQQKRRSSGGTSSSKRYLDNSSYSFGPPAPDTDPASKKHGGYYSIDGYDDIDDDDENDSLFLAANENDIIPIQSFVVVPEQPPLGGSASTSRRSSVTSNHSNPYNNNNNNNNGEIQLLPLNIHNGEASWTVTTTPTSTSMYSSNGHNGHSGSSTTNRTTTIKAISTSATLSFCTCTGRLCQYIPCYIIVGIFLSFGSILIHHSNTMLNEGLVSDIDNYDSATNNKNHNNNFQLPIHTIASTTTTSSSSDNATKNSSTNTGNIPNDLLQMAPSDLEDWCTSIDGGDEPISKNECWDTCNKASNCCIVEDVENNNKEDDCHKYYDQQTKHIICWSYRYCEIIIPEFAIYVDMNVGEHHNQETQEESINTIDIDYVPSPSSSDDVNEENDKDNDDSSSSTTTTDSGNNNDNYVSTIDLNKIIETMNNISIEDINESCNFLYFEQDYELIDDCNILCDVAKCCTISSDENEDRSSSCLTDTHKELCYKFIPCIVVNDKFNIVITQQILDDTKDDGIIDNTSIITPSLLLPPDNIKTYCDKSYITSPGGVVGYCEDICSVASCCVHPNTILNCYNIHTDICIQYAKYCSIVLTPFKTLLLEESSSSSSSSEESETTTNDNNIVTKVPYPTIDLSEVCSEFVINESNIEDCINACIPSKCCFLSNNKNNCLQHDTTTNNVDRCKQYTPYCQTIVNWDTYYNNHNDNENDNDNDNRNNMNNRINDNHNNIPTDSASTDTITTTNTDTSNSSSSTTTAANLSTAIGPLDIPPTNINYVCNKETLLKDAYPCANICEESLCCFPNETNYNPCTSLIAQNQYCPLYISCRNLWNT